MLVLTEFSNKKQHYRQDVSINGKVEDKNVMKNKDITMIIHKC